jgi:hypothetical protein
MKYLYWLLYQRYVYAYKAKRLPKESKIGSIYRLFATHYPPSIFKEKNNA